MRRAHPCGVAATAALALFASAALGAASPLPAPGPGTTPAQPLLAVTADDLGFDRILFVKRKPYSSDHYYTDADNGTSPDRFLPANGIYVYDLRQRVERKVISAADLPGGKGFVGKIALSFDAQRVLFDFREAPGAGFRVWEVKVDGSELRQVARPPPDENEKSARRGAGPTDDLHPCYLPDGRIMFTSTRTEHTVLCSGTASLSAPSLHRMNADGTQIEPVTQSLVSEFCPVVLDDGRVMYHRWEYIDRGARVSKTLLRSPPRAVGAARSEEHRIRPGRFPSQGHLRGGHRHGRAGLAPIVPRAGTQRQSN